MPKRKRIAMHDAKAKKRENTILEDKERENACVRERRVDHSKRQGTMTMEAKEEVDANGGGVRKEGGELHKDSNDEGNAASLLSVHLHQGMYRARDDAATMDVSLGVLRSDGYKGGE
jgi:hypothetical protein